MHTGKDGTANRSCSLQVAALGGLPKTVIGDARRYLWALEQGHEVTAAVAAPPAANTPQMGLFAPSLPSPVEEALRSIDPDDLSPRDALEQLYKLRKMLR